MDEVKYMEIIMLCYENSALMINKHRFIFSFVFAFVVIKLHRHICKGVFISRPVCLF